MRTNLVILEHTSPRLYFKGQRVFYSRHANQGGLLLGAKEFVASGALLRISAGLNITVAAVSQPGFGASDGPLNIKGAQIYG